MAETLGDGIIRTASGRQTYAPDGLLSADHQIPQYTDQQTQYQSRVASISGTTTAHSTRSSISGPSGKSEDDDKNLKSKKTSLPAGLTAGFNEENFSSEADVEMQRERTNRSSLNEKKNDDDDEKDDGNEEEKDPNLVDWDGPDDPGNPMNMPEWKKWMITVVAGLMTFSVTFASSVFSTATTVTSQIFGVSEEVMILGTSLFVLGFAFGKLSTRTAEFMFLTANRTNCLESFLGAVRPQDPPVHRILHFRYLPDSCRG